jgi:hypothetical protein
MHTDLMFVLSDLPGHVELTYAIKYQGFGVFLAYSEPYNRCLYSLAGLRYVYVSVLIISPFFHYQIVSLSPLARPTHISISPRCLTCCLIPSSLTSHLCLLQNQCLTFGLYVSVSNLRSLFQRQGD